MDRNAEPATLVRGLADTLTRFNAAAEQLDPARLVEPPPPGGWAPNEILWHVRASADVYGEYIARILSEETPRWRHVSPRARMKKARYDELPFADSLAAFVRQRTELVTLLAGLPPEAWQRTALVRVDRREGPLTLHERVWGMANHEQVHCAQLDRLVSLLAAR